MGFYSWSWHFRKMEPMTSVFLVIPPNFHQRMTIVRTRKFYVWKHFFSFHSVRWPISLSCRVHRQRVHQSAQPEPVGWKQPKLIAAGAPAWRRGWWVGHDFQEPRLSAGRSLPWHGRPGEAGLESAAHGGGCRLGAEEVPQVEAAAQSEQFQQLYFCSDETHPSQTDSQEEVLGWLSENVWHCSVTFEGGDQSAGLVSYGRFSREGEKTAAYACLRHWSLWCFRDLELNKGLSERDFWCAWAKAALHFWFQSFTITRIPGDDSQV